MIKAKQDRLSAKNHLYDCIIEVENADLRIKSIPEELEMLEFNTKEEIELMKRQIKLSKEAIVPLEPAVEEIKVTVDPLNGVIHKDHILSMKIMLLFRL